MPARASSQNASRLKTISCPLAFMASTAAEFTCNPTAVITMAPRAALILVEPSFRQTLHVAAEAPESNANTIADENTFASFATAPQMDLAVA